MPNGPGSQNALRISLDNFTAETRIPVRLVIIDWSEAFSRITQALETGNGPDVLQVGSTWVSYFAEKGFLADLSRFWIAWIPRDLCR
jgi:multiple sugar transport system substrate-binding protein